MRQVAGSETSTFTVGSVLLNVTGDAAARLAVERQMDPLVPQADTRHPDVAVSVLPPGAAAPAFDDVLNPSRDGTVTAWDGARAYLLDGAEWCTLPAPSGGDGLEIECSHDFSPAMLMTAIVRPAMQLAMLQRHSCAVHSAAAAFGRNGVLIAGWSETGKTETALALGEVGARFVSDKWTCLGSDGTLSPFPISVGIRRWVVPYLPTLQSRLPRAARVQLWVAGMIDALARPVRRASGRGVVPRRAAAVVDTVTALADRAALRQSTLQDVYGGDGRTDEVPRLGLLVLLSTGSAESVSVHEVDARFAARRLARSASYERRSFFDLQERARYSLMDGDGDGDGDGAGDADARRRTEAIEEAFLLETLAPVTIVEVRTPFPVDPRRVTSALEPWL